MASPYIVTLAGDPGGAMRRKAAVGAYWRSALDRFPDLRFELLGAFAGVGSVAILYRGVRGVRACEVLTFGGDGLVTRAAAHHDA